MSSSGFVFQCVIIGLCLRSFDCSIFRTACIYCAYIIMQTPPNLDNQQDWGGQQFRTGSSDNAQTIRTHGAREELRNVPSSQRGFIASDSDDLFHPTPIVPSYVSRYQGIFFLPLLLHPIIILHLQFLHLPFFLVIIILLNIDLHILSFVHQHLRFLLLLNVNLHIPSFQINRHISLRFLLILKYIIIFRILQVLPLHLQLFLLFLKLCPLPLIFHFLLLNLIFTLGMKL